MTSPQQPKRAPGRPRTSVLTRERILEAAFALSDERGADISLAALARTLAVKPPALHHYFANKDDLIAGMRGQLTARIGDHGFATLPWHEAVLPWSIAYREALGNRPGLIAALATLPVADEPESIADYNRIAAAFLRDGYPQHLIVPALVAIESFIIGSALDALTPEDNLRPVSDPDEAPALAAAESSARAHAATQQHTLTDLTFEFGLRALVTGLKITAQEGAPTAAPVIPIP